MGDISKKIFKKIKEKHLEPKPRWQFLLKDSLLWLGFGVLVVIGSLAFSVVVFMLTDKDWDLYLYVNRSFWNLLLVNLPYVWLICLGLFWLLSFYNFKHTKGGYRYQPWIIFSGSIATSFVLGALFFYTGLGQQVDEILARNVPQYCQMMFPEKTLWQQPDKGLLLGRVVEMKDGDNFILRDTDNMLWTIQRASRSLDLPPLRPGLQLKILGSRQDDKFITQRVRILQSACQRLERECASSACFGGINQPR